MGKHIRWQLLVAGAAVVTVASACSSSASQTTSSSSSTSSGGSGSSSTSNSDPYVVGAVTSLSGSLAFIGNALKSGSAAYYNYVNSQGGVNGHPIKFIAEDDASGDVNTALTATHQLVQQDGALVLSGWVLTNIESAVEPYAARQNVSMVVQGCDPTIADAASKVVFCASLPENLEDQAEVQFASTKASSGPVKVAILSMDSVAQAQLEKRIAADAKAKGWQVVLQQLVPLTASDMSAQASAVQSSGATIFIGSLDSQREQLFDKSLRSLGSKIPIVNYDGGAALGTLDALKDPNLYVYSGDGFPTDSGSAIALYDKLMKAAKADPAAGFAINGYLEAMVTVAGLKACGWPCSPSQLVTAMTGLGTVSTGGISVSPVKYSSSYYLGLTGGKFYAYNTQQSKPVVVSGFYPVASP
jgi:branched-chain amino acid transport system substrate-binding protein